MREKLTVKKTTDETRRGERRAPVRPFGLAPRTRAQAAKPAGPAADAAAGKGGVERSRSEPTGQDQPRGDRPSGDRPGRDRPQGARAGSERARFDKPRGERPDGDRPRFDKPRGERSDGERPRFDKPRGERADGDRPRFDKPRGERPGGDRPRFDKARGERADGDRPRFDKPRGERADGGRPRFDKPRSERSDGERPRFDKPRGERPDGDRPRFDKPRGERPDSERSRFDKPRSERADGDRPRFDQARGDRSNSERPRFDKPRGERPSGDRPRFDKPWGERADGDRPRFDKARGDRSNGERPRFDKPRGERADADRPRSDKPRGERDDAVRALPSRRFTPRFSDENGKPAAHDTMSGERRRAADARGSRPPPSAAQAVREPAGHAAHAPTAGLQGDEDLPRLSKRMSELGMCSRREADEWISKGWVSVDGAVAVLGQRVEPGQSIEIDRRARREQAQSATFLLHKPIGYVSGQPEDEHPPAVALLKPDAQWLPVGVSEPARFDRAMLRQLAPAGRLDIDSTGLLVLTQDGRIAKQLIGENSEIDKEYLVRVRFGEYVQDVAAHFPADRLARLRHGLSLDGVALKPAEVEWQNGEQLRFVLTEGRKRQIRRMCELVGLDVVGLKRIRIGRVMLGDLPVGQWRLLRDGEHF